MKNMNKILKSLQHLFSLILLVSLIASCKTSKAQVDDASKIASNVIKNDKLANALLWKINGKELGLII